MASKWKVRTSGRILQYLGKSRDHHGEADSNEAFWDTAQQPEMKGEDDREI
jgi:hypothetical protein